jgi:hypothetical protein
MIVQVTSHDVETTMNTTASQIAAVGQFRRYLILSQSSMAYGFRRRVDRQRLFFVLD